MPDPESIKPGEVPAGGDQFSDAEKSGREIPPEMKAKYKKKLGTMLAQK